MLHINNRKSTLYPIEILSSTSRLVWVLVLLIILSLRCSEPLDSDESSKPNIVLIMGDDIGISDLGCYGSEILTPNIDRLAQEGMRFQTFYNMAKCEMTRASLLTGRYTGGEGVVHLAQLTKSAGYHNIMSGKEHFSKWVPDYCAAPEVFDHSFTFWATTEYFLPPADTFERPFYLEGEKIDPSEIKHRIEPMYKTDFITDYALDWLEESKGLPNPFFLYLPYHSAHYPLQARPQDIAKYRGKYLQGWEALRESRFAKMKELGVLPEHAVLSPAEKNLNTRRKPLIPEYIDILNWDTLSAEKKDSLDLEMAVFAAMIDRMDQNIGRVLQWLEANGKIDNTLILFLVDNGSCPFYSNKSNTPPGPADSYYCLRAAWANVGNTPYRQYKQCGLGGGSHTPLIVRWPGVVAPNSISDQVGHVVDFLPTFLDVLEIPYPDRIAGHRTLPPQGASLLPILQGKQREEPEYFSSGMPPHAMYRAGDYKITRLNNGPWELYQVKEDPTELYNRAADLPLLVDSLSQAYELLWQGD